jgi:hypothetical protein
MRAQRLQTAQSMWSACSTCCLAAVTLALLVCQPLAAHMGGSGAADGGDLEKRDKGYWYAPPLPPLADRMQAVHAVLLPSGKVLIASGSSNRDRLEEGEIRDGVDVQDYATVDNTAIFDPEAPPGRHGITRIASPTLPDGDDSTDLFCAGHIHLWNGNVLFVGGTRLYYPPESFRGHKHAVVFDWRTLTWQSVGKTRDGHWYPSLVALSDGRVAVFSGFSYDRAAISEWTEFYDPEQPPDRAWTAVHIGGVPNGPFSSAVGQDPANLDGMHWYPKIFPLPDGRLLLTHDGAGLSNLESRNTYFMTVAGGNGAQPPAVAFQPGPERAVIQNRSYGTAVVDPNSPNGDILLIGGQAGHDNINHGPGAYALPGASVTADLERFRLPTARDGWSVELTKNFLGEQPEDARVMHWAVILPTKQLLITGGGNYALHRPVYHPLLLTPDPAAPGGYRQRRLAPASQPRLYHNVALLLPDGRVLTAGGNPGRAVRNSATGSVQLLVKRTPQGVVRMAEPGEFVLPAENWQIEIFSPPYLFLPGARPEIIQAPQVLPYGASARLAVRHMTANASLVLIKLGSATHGWDNGQRLADLPISQDQATGEVTFTAPTNRHTNPPGYYMLFYVNDEGKPSRAAMVRLGGTPPEPGEVLSK